MKSATFALLALLFLGCDSPVDGTAPYRPTEPPPRVKRTQLSSSLFTWGVYDVEIDGEHYIVVSDSDGVAICPKTKPTAEKP
jgi:hypothetical protein